MQTAPAWVIKPLFRQGEITLTNGGANKNKMLPKMAKTAKMDKTAKMAKKAQ